MMWFVTHTAAHVPKTTAARRLPSPRHFAGSETHKQEKPFHLGDLQFGFFHFR